MYFSQPFYIVSNNLRYTIKIGMAGPTSESKGGGAGESSPSFFKKGKKKLRICLLHLFCALTRPKNRKTF